MMIQDIQKLIDNKLEPNAQECAMDVEDVLTDNRIKCGNT